MEFSTTLEADQDCATCQEGHLFLADMTAEAQGALQFSASINGQQTPVLPLQQEYLLNSTATGALQYNLGGESLTVIPDLTEYNLRLPEQVKGAIAAPEDPMPERAPAVLYPRGMNSARAFSPNRFMFTDEMRQIAAEDPDAWLEMEHARQTMGFEYSLRDRFSSTSDLIRHLGGLDSRLQQALDTSRLSARGERYLRRMTTRYRSILQAEIARREQPRGEGVFAIALKTGCIAAQLPDGPMTLDALDPAEGTSLGECLAEAFNVSWEDYLEEIKDEENLEAAAGSAGQAMKLEAVKGAATAANDLGRFTQDLRMAFMASVSQRRARRWLSSPPTFSQWVHMHRVFLREIMSTDFEIKTWQGQKTVRFAGKASLRAYLTKARYSKDSFRVLDAVSRGQPPSLARSIKGAFTGAINRVFIVVAGVLEIKAWLESEKEDWADLIARLTTVVISTVVVTILTVALTASFVLGAPVILAGLAVGTVSVIVAFGTIAAMEFLKLREKMANFIRFMGRMLFNALAHMWQEIWS
ncbi:hypothetical protein [Epibacterium sp. Ofav1-8]|uniref:hypothetical protein n=1 Tax=Epibacterium sp. Ofav1-8 TaxID=2917735 RepID=UPI001EF5D35C|nr:hypothetical protein [Epibacterium sp. Ofav1-8]MCG7625993.1 hypothetical protein [Epibacterium sp. Ofav1-8]